MNIIPNDVPSCDFLEGQVEHMEYWFQTKRA